MSVDLVGSTAFKGNKDYSQPNGKSPLPVWVEAFRTFYKEFPLEVAWSYDAVVKSFGEDLQENIGDNPRIWKTISDEIIFCNRVRSTEHTAACVSGFLKALERYSKRLEADRMPLRVKGAGWLAAFPAPNTSIAVISDMTGSDDARGPSENDEAFEQAADDAPNKFDFLGKGIDTGFRIAKNASEDRFAASVQLGYVLARAATRKRFPHSFGYHGREGLKGVIDGAPYPVISVDTERSDLKSELRSREAALTGEVTVQAHGLRDFLETFREVSGIEIPCLDEAQSAWNGAWPESYVRYQTAFDEQLAIDDRNVSQVGDAEDPDEPDDSSLDQPRQFLTELIPAADEGAAAAPAADAHEAAPSSEGA